MKHFVFTISHFYDKQPILKVLEIWSNLYMNLGDLNGVLYKFNGDALNRTIALTNYKSAAVLNPNNSTHLVLIMT